jgi:hypothetical protein
MSDGQETKSSPKKESAASRRLPPFDDDEDEDDDDDDDDVDGDDVDGGDGYSSLLRHRAKKARKVKQSVVDHTYRDYSRVEVTATDDEENGEDDEEEEDQQRHDNRRRKEPHKKASSNFPARLHAILSNPMYYNIIRWMVSKRLILL